MPLSEALIRLDGVTQQFDGRTVLHDVTLRIGGSDCLILHGPNGGGKTTLLRLIAGLQSPAAGTVTRAAGLRIGYLPQARSIDRQFPITVGQVVSSGLAGRRPWWRRTDRDAQRTLGRTLERFHLADLADRPISALSGGQWQRALLARALVGWPGLLLLDEPDTYLDATAKGELYAFIREAAGSCAVVIASHDPALPSCLPGAEVLTVNGGSVTPAGAAPAPHIF